MPIFVLPHHVLDARVVTTLKYVIMNFKESWMIANLIVPSAKNLYTRPKSASYPEKKESGTFKLKSDVRTVLVLTTKHIIALPKNVENAMSYREHDAHETPNNTNRVKIKNSKLKIIKFYMSIL